MLNLQVAFTQKKQKNIIYCQYHLDEFKPYIHIKVIPTTSDGRLSNKILFYPKILKQLQTDFHREISQHYEFEHGEHHSSRTKKYLPPNINWDIINSL